MLVYLAGPMRGIDHYNFPAFDYAAKRLRMVGHEVINPAELDRVVHVHEWTRPLPANFMKGAMKRDLIAICDEAEGIVLLPGWQASSGVAVEKALTDLLGLPSFEGDDLGPKPKEQYLAEWMDSIIKQMEASLEPCISNT